MFPNLKFQNWIPDFKPKLEHKFLKNFVSAYLKLQNNPLKRTSFLYLTKNIQISKLMITFNQPQSQGQDILMKWILLDYQCQIQRLFNCTLSFLKIFWILFMAAFKAFWLPQKIYWLFFLTDKYFCKFNVQTQLFYAWTMKPKE